MNRVRLSKAFLETAVSANIDNEIVTAGISKPELDQVSKEVAEAVQAAERETANDAIQLFSSRINRIRR